MQNHRVYVLAKYHSGQNTRAKPVFLSIYRRELRQQLATLDR